MVDVVNCLDHITKIFLKYENFYNSVLECNTIFFKYKYLNLLILLFHRNRVLLPIHKIGLMDFYLKILL
jgi:hypothetical protein